MTPKLYHLREKNWNDFIYGAVFHGKELFSNKPLLLIIARNFLHGRTHVHLVTTVLNIALLKEVSGVYISGRII